MGMATIEKAQRLHREGRVREVPTDRSFEVQGDRGAYHVVIAHDMTGAWCTCPASRACSHITAVLLQIRDERGEGA